MNQVATWNLLMHRIWIPTPWHAEGTSHFHGALSSNYVAFWRSLESLGWKTEMSEGWQRKMQNSIHAVLIGFLMVHISGHLERSESAAKSTGKQEGYVLEWLFQTRSKISGTGNTIVWPLLQAKKKEKDTPIFCWLQWYNRMTDLRYQRKATSETYNGNVITQSFHESITQGRLAALSVSTWGARYSSTSWIIKACIWGSGVCTRLGTQRERCNKNIPYSSDHVTYCSRDIKYVK